MAEAMTETERLIADLVADRLTARIAEYYRHIEPERVYTREEAAELLTVDRPKTLAQFPPEILPTVAITPGGRRKGYYGRDLIRFIRDRRDRNAPPLED